jgi:hypothetical protein
MVFAFSKDLAAFDLEPVSIPVPDFVEAIGSAFRSTGRFVWPLLYVVTIGAVVLVARKVRPLVAVPLIVIAFGAQAYDSSHKWSRFTGMREPGPMWERELVSPLWRRAAALGYTRIRSIPVQEGFGTDWKAFGYFATTHGMDTDMAYLGRVDGQKLSDLRAKEEQALATGEFEPMTIYILDVPASVRVARHAGPDDLITVADHRIVFLPGGAALGEGLGWAGD